jgi:hypothetical protein
MPTITHEDLESDDPFTIDFMEQILVEEDRRFFESLPDVIAAAARRRRLKANRRKKQARARTGRRTK